MWFLRSQQPASVSPRCCHAKRGAAQQAPDRVSVLPRASLIGAPVHCRLYLVGNPTIAAKIVQIDARACLYVPFRVAIYVERGSTATTISFDRPSSSLGVLGRSELQPIGQMLDQKIDAVVQSIGR
jgi:hypothetical protein